MARNITPRKENYSQWYLDVIKAAELADYAPVRGCMVIRPTGFAIWENIKQKLDTEFKNTGHVNAYFPVLIPNSFLQKEAEHIEGFAPECAVVTHAGGEELEEPFVVRPTSETIIGHMYSKWVQSWRDLPVLINQWCNVMRWEKRPRLFLRTSEFLWQEGHTAHETEKEAREETLKMLAVYKHVFENELAIPILDGEKTAGERFPGAVDTYTCEAMMSDAKALQAGTSHFLEIQYQDREGNLQYCFTTSWGVSTRSVGALIMTHSDDDGLIIPPRIAPTKIVILPISKDESTAENILLPKAKELAEKLNNSLGSLSVKIDTQFHMRPADRFFAHLQKGIPLRLELGEKDLNAGTVRFVRRDTGEKIDVKFENAIHEAANILDDIQNNLFKRAKDFREANTHEAGSYDELKKILAEKGGFVKAFFAGTPEDEVKIREETGGATPRCVLSHEGNGKCIITGKPEGRMTVFAKAY